MPDIHLEECIAGLEWSYRDITKGIDGLKAEVSLLLINWLSLLAGIFLFALKK